ncbi:hypothetical protein [Rossellomorea vietnamensis]|uniref:hypothetical protein n=1 Tax=Rossellomorea vietnamensis TaxID=218284 RepID=UPI003D29D0F3
MENLHLCPIPYLLLDRQFNLIDASNTGYNFLIPGENFMSIVEEESSPKFARIIHKHPKGEMELNVKKNDTFELFDISFQFSEVQQYYHVVLIAKDLQYKKVSEQMNSLFDMMGKPAYSRKEPNLTEALAKVSSLFLKLSNTSDWNRQEIMDKIKEIEHHIQENVK